MKNARTESKQEISGTEIDTRDDFLIEHTSSQISAPKLLAAVRKRNIGHMLTHVDQTFIRDGLPALN